MRSFESEVGIAPGGWADSLLTEGQFLEPRRDSTGLAQQAMLWEVVGQLSHAGIDVARLGRAKPGEKRASKGRQPTRIGRVVTAAPGPNCTCSYLVALRVAAH